MLLTLADGEFYPSTGSGSGSGSGSGGRSASVSPPPIGGSGSGVVLPPFRVSLLSLLADFIDSSCNELRADLQDLVNTGDNTLNNNSSDTDSDGSYELISSISSLQIDEEVVIVAADSASASVRVGTSERSKRISSGIEMHLGWMRDLRGEKPPSAVRLRPTPTDAGSETDATEEVQAKVEKEKEEDVEGDGVTVEVEVEFESESVAVDVTVQVEVDIEVTVEKNHDEGIEDEEEEVSPSIPVSTPEMKTEENKSKKEEEEVPSQPQSEDPFVSGGVRLALLPDFRSKILWLAALVDVEGVIMIVREELHVRLKEIIDASSSSSPTPSDSSSSSSFLPIESQRVSFSLGLCDSFCSLIVSGVRSAAAPLTVGEVRH